MSSEASASWETILAEAGAATPAPKKKGKNRITGCTNPRCQHLAIDLRAMHRASRKDVGLHLGCCAGYPQIQGGCGHEPGCKNSVAEKSKAKNAVFNQGPGVVHLFGAITVNGAHIPHDNSGEKEDWFDIIIEKTGIAGGVRSTTIITATRGYKTEGACRNTRTGNEIIVALPRTSATRAAPPAPCVTLCFIEAKAGHELSAGGIGGVQRGKKQRMSRSGVEMREITATSRGEQRGGQRGRAAGADSKAHRGLS